MIYGRPLPKSHRKKLLISTYLQYKSKEHSNISSLILFNHVLHGYWKKNVLLKSVLRRNIFFRTGHIFMQFKDKIGILLPKLFWPTDREKLLKFKVKAENLNIFEITRPTYSNSKRSEQFLVTEYIFNSRGFSCLKNYNNYS